MSFQHASDRLGCGGYSLKIDVDAFDPLDDAGRDAHDVQVAATQRKDPT
jgi:hypothetical protein